jgi:hypothetical protein
VTAPKHDDHHLVAARLGSVVEQFQRMANSDATILETTKRAADFLDPEEGIKLLKLTDPELAEKGWTRRELKVAIHACRPKSEAPFYMLAAQERHVSRMKTLPTEGGGSDKAKGYIIASAPPPPPDDDDDDYIPPAKDPAP